MSFKELRNLIVGNALCQTLDDSCLAHAWVTYHEHIGLEATCQYCNHFIKIMLAANQGFKLIIARHVGQVDAVLFENLGCLFVVDFDFALSIVGFPELYKLWLGNTVL